MDTSSTHTADVAWTPTTGTPLRLPVYHQFSFHTSDQGDFESLVRRLVPTKFGADIGEHEMAVDDPMHDVPSAGAPLMLQGALKSIVAQPSAWNDPEKTEFQTAVAALVNRVSPLVDDPKGPDPRVVPPMYGRWPAGVDTVTPGGTRWLDELSLDPRSRTIAGMGTLVVQGSLTSLMASAWQQVAGIEAANAALRRAQLARATMTMLHAQIAGALDATVVTLTAPLHAKVLASPTTIRATIEASRVAVRLASPAARRLTHPTSVIRRRQRAAVSPGSIVERVSRGSIAVVPAPAPPGGLVAIEDVGEAHDRDEPWRAWLPLTLRADTPAGEFTATIDVASRSPLSPATLTADDVGAVPPRPRFVLTQPGERAPDPGEGSQGTEDSPTAARLRTALGQVAAVWQLAEPDPPLGPELDFAALRSTLVERLDPATTVPARMQSLVRIHDRLDWKPEDPIREIMAAPSFPQPMYAPLRDLSVNYIMPGADLIPNETVGLVHADHVFVESYMVGLSHEMARQLLFAGYPTDCMGTYFRQFWDVRGYVRQPGDPSDPQALAELLRDIPPIVAWHLADGLGFHENRPADVPDPIVLIVRGELLRRYPDAVIYAAKAKIEGDHRTIDDGSPTLHPIFSGLLKPDMNFFGFNLSPADAKGGTADAPNGYFIVFQQHPEGPRFGLEPSADGSVTQWADLAWTNFGNPAVHADDHGGGAMVHADAQLASRLLPPFTEALLASSAFAEVLAQHPIPPFLSASAAPSGVTVSGGDAAYAWGADAAQTAYITARLPFRVGIHADMMIPDPA
jgi:hypothetical protein